MEALPYLAPHSQTIFHGICNQDFYTSIWQSGWRLLYAIKAMHNQHGEHL